MKNQRFKRLIFLNIGLGFLGLLGLTFTLQALSPLEGFFFGGSEDVEPINASGIGTGILCLAYFLYLGIMSTELWDKLK